MPPSSSIKGSDPTPPAATSNPTQCGAQDCINHVGCFIDMAGGVRAVPTPALQSGAFGVANWKWTALLCAQEAKKNGGSVFAIQVGTWMWGVVGADLGLGRPAQHPASYH